MCKYKVQEKAKLNLLDIINILDLFLKSAKEVLIMMVSQRSIDNDVFEKSDHKSSVRIAISIKILQF